MGESLQEQFRNSRPKRLTNEPALWVENRVVLPQDEEPFAYAEQIDKFVPLSRAVQQREINQDMWQKAETELQKLFKSMQLVREKLNKKSKGKYPEIDFHKCNWDEVISEVTSTAQIWKTLPNPSAKAQRCMQKLGQGEGAFEAWLDLLPAGDYGSSICGAFKLAIGAANRFKKVEDSIYDALSEIPENMEYARRYLKIYRDHPDSLLERKTFDLYVAVLQALNHVMQFFADSSIRKIVGPLFQQSGYKADLVKSIDFVKNCILNIEKEANQCLAERQANMDITTQRSYREISTISTKMDQHEIVLNSLYRMVQSSPIYNLRGSAAEAHLTRIESLLSAQSDSQLLRTPSPQDYRRLAKAVLMLLNFEQSIVDNDLKRSLRQGDLLDDISKARGASMIQSDEFRAWLAENGSRGLLVNGCADLASIDSGSPLSLVVAEVVKAVRANEPAYVVEYFCDYHTKADDSSQNMLLSLLGQLLTQMMAKQQAIDLTHLTDDQDKKIQDHDFNYLCILFRDLVEELPPKTVLIIALDEIGLYESKPLRRDTETLVRRLTRLVENSAITIKLLLTCHGQARGIRQYFARDDILYIPEDIDPDDTATWQINQVGKVAGRMGRDRGKRTRENS